MFCPECEGEFKPEIAVCPDCGVHLVVELPQHDTADLVPIFETSDASILPVIKSVLAAAKIPFVVQGEQTVGIDPVGRIAETVGFRALTAIVLVPADRKDEAKLLLETKGEYGAL